MYSTVFTFLIVICAITYKSCSFKTEGKACKQKHLLSQVRFYAKKVFSLQKPEAKLMLKWVLSNPFFLAWIHSLSSWSTTYNTDRNKRIHHCYYCCHIRTIFWGFSFKYIRWVFLKVKLMKRTDSTTQIYSESILILILKVLLHFASNSKTRVRCSMDIGIYTYNY